MIQRRDGAAIHAGAARQFRDGELVSAHQGRKMTTDHLRIHSWGDAQDSIILICATPSHAPKTSFGWYCVSNFGQIDLWNELRNAVWCLAGYSQFERQFARVLCDQTGEAR